MQVTDLLSPGELLPLGSKPRGEGIAEFWRRRGHKVFEADGMLWGHYSSSVYVSLPFHLQLAPEPGEIAGLLRRNHVTCVRFPSLTTPGAPAAMFVCNPRGYSIESVNRKQRSQVQAGLDRCVIRPVDSDQLERDGLELNLDTMQRQNRYDSEFGNPRRWKRFIDAMQGNAAISTLGAFVDGRLSAYMVLCLEDGWLHALYQMSRSADREFYINHALDYSVIYRASLNPSVHMVGNWYASADPAAGLDRYKRALGYGKVSLNLAAVLHPALAPVATSRLAFATLKTARRIQPKSDLLREANDLLDTAVLSKQAKAPDPCQHEESIEYSRPWRPHAVFLTWWYSRQIHKRGLTGSVRFAWEKLSARLRRANKQSAPRPHEPEEVLGLQPGDWVEVKAEHEIDATLDKRGKNRGLLFTNEMRPYFGRKFKVIKRVERIFLEESRQNRKLKNTVLLEGVHCSGAEMQCDRNCFLFWKEVWLRRTTPPPGLVNWQGTQIQLVSLSPKCNE